MHGGADGSGAPEGSKNGNYKHGRYTKEVAATRQWLREATHMLRDLKKRPDNNRNDRQLNTRATDIDQRSDVLQIRPSGTNTLPACSFESAAGSRDLAEGGCPRE
jgi:hypothetical protein